MAAPVSLSSIQTFESALTLNTGTIALAISVVADLAPPHERGKYVGAALSGYVAEKMASLRSAMY